MQNDANNMATVARLMDDVSPVDGSFVIDPEQKFGGAA